MQRARLSFVGALVQSGANTRRDTPLGGLRVGGGLRHLVNPGEVMVRGTGVQAAARCRVIAWRPTHPAPRAGCRVGPHWIRTRQIKQTTATTTLLYYVCDFTRLAFSLILEF